MSRKPAKKLPVNVASRWKKKAVKEEEEEARWAEIESKNASNSKRGIQQIELAQKQLKLFVQPEQHQDIDIENDIIGNIIQEYAGSVSGIDTDSDSDVSEKNNTLSSKKKRDGLKKKAKEKERLIKKRSRWSGRRRLKGREIDEDDEDRWKVIIREQQQKQQSITSSSSAVPAQGVFANRSCLTKTISATSKSGEGKSTVEATKSVKTMNPALLRRLHGDKSWAARTTSAAGHSPTSNACTKLTSSAAPVLSSANIFDILVTRKKTKYNNSSK